MKKAGTISKSSTFGQKVNNFIKKRGVELAVLLLIVVTGILEPKSLRISNIINVLRQISVTGFIAIGMTFVIISNGIDLSVAGVVGLTGMLAIMTQQGGSGSLIVSILVVLAVAAATGMINGYFITKGFAPFIMTMAFDTVLRGLAYLTTNGQPVAGISGSYQFIGGGDIFGIPFPVILFAAAILGANFVLTRTSFGRKVFAVGGNLEAARLAGINVLRIKMSVHVISAVMAGITAIVLTSRMSGSDPTVGLNFQTDAIAATVIGGTSMAGGEGNVYRTIIGCLIIGVLSNTFNLLGISPYLQQVMKGVIIFAAVLWDNRKHSKKAA